RQRVADDADVVPLLQLKRRPPNGSCHGQDQKRGENASHKNQSWESNPGERAIQWGGVRRGANLDDSNLGSGQQARRLDVPENGLRTKSGKSPIASVRCS